MLRKKIFYLSLIIYFVGTGFLINNFLIHSKLKNSNFELPIIGFQGLVEKNDTIYIGSSYWNRILLFDKNGNYLTYQGTGGKKGRDFEFYFSNNRLIINEFILQDNPNSNISSFEINDDKKYLIDKKLPLKITLEQNSKKNIFIKQSLLLYATKSDVGLWLVLMFYSLFIITFFNDYLLNFRNAIKERLK